ncbi:MAG: 2,3-bisphosphoglycerate-independent phosphoglycerate mutase [Alphaproteobacteria bacterium]|nr:2,3-bisphosphoglycerate-independent phosphoglycerate mutase [Alphaproteobacteria bacterium]
MWTKPEGPVVLCILDGVGLGDGGEDDAVATARTPVLDRLLRTCPTLALRAHGPAVGLPSEQDMGNSEVGHNALGAGRVFDQGAKLVNLALQQEETWSSDVWRRLVGGRTLHLLGLLSDGNVHSHVDHLRALIARAVHDGVTRLRVHVLTDGRDVGRRTALTWLVPLEAELAALADQGVDARVASGGGRMRITMDRYEADWPMVQRGWDTHVLGRARAFPSAVAAVETAYAEDPEVDDQYVPPFVVADADGAPVGTIEDGDAVLLFNFRGDRAVEISRAFTEPGLDHLDRARVPQVYFAGMMQYDGDLGVPEHFLVQPPRIDGTVGAELVAHGLRTFACAETQKFGHVTYFFNGNRSGLLDPALETYTEVPSDRRPFDEAPWMRCAEVTDACLEAVASGRYDHVRLNYANGDMVGHTGNLEATRVAMACVDLQLGRLERAVRAAGGILLVTADHGNADGMWTRDKRGEVVRDDDGRPQPRTSHTLAPVPFVVVDPAGRVEVCDDLVAPGLASVGSTLLALLGLDPPAGWAPVLVRPIFETPTAS